MPSRRLPLAFAASLLLHGLILAGGFAPAPPAPATATPAMLDATLLPPARAEAEPLLKDTLAEAEPQPRPPPRPAPDTRGRRPADGGAQRKLAEHVYYPPEAVARGLEGEVRLLLTLAADGTVLDAQVASGSGHEILDRAALRAAYAMGRLPAGGPRELILPVVFRLR